MDYGSDLPDDIMDAVLFIREARGRDFLSRADRENLNRAKLRIAFWACRSENVMPSRETLTYILGPDAPEIMGNYDKYLERADERDEAARRNKKDKDAFWGGA